MSEKKQDKTIAAVKKSSSKLRTRNSVSWNEHDERVRIAIEFSTGFFLHANSEKIDKASSATAARNSYLSGMIDMLTVARNALGFWGADQILMELERLTDKRAAATDSIESTKLGQVGGHVEGPTKATVEAQESQTVEQKAAKGVRRDPMFA